MSPDRCRVLIVDSQPENRRLLYTLLEQLGCTVSSAVDIDEAGNALAQAPFDLVFVDVRLPDPDLAAVIEHLTAVAAFAAPRVAAVTASVFAASDEQVFDAGFDGFLNKPFSERELRSLLETLADARFAVRNPDAQDAAPASWPTSLAHATADRIDTAVAMGDVASLFQLAEDLADEPGAPQTQVERLALMARSFDFDGLSRLAQSLRERA